MSKSLRVSALTGVLALAAACRSAQPGPATPPPTPTSPAVRSTPSAAPPPAAAVPAQPKADSGERPYLEILRLKQSGASDEALLEKVRAGNTVYQLTTAEILELRQAGVGEAVVAAMVRSGR